MTDSLLSSNEAAARLGVTARTIRMWAESGVLEAWKTPGGHRRFRASDVDKLRRTAAATTADAGLTVLLVEDDARLLDVYRRYLETLDLNLRIETAEDGYQALVRIGMLKPGLIVTDLNMPNIDGFEMIEAIRAEPTLEDTAVVVVTGLDRPELDADGRLPDDVPVYTKPLPLKTLEAIVQDALAASTADTNSRIVAPRDAAPHS